jgi:VCBS repeat-containing protein
MITASGESQINTDSIGDQTAPIAIFLASGGYAVVWATPSGWSLQRFTTDGTAAGNEVALPEPSVPVDGTHYTYGTPTNYDYTGPADFDIIELPDGDFLYAYSVNVSSSGIQNYHLMAYTGVIEDDGTIVRPAGWTLFSGGDPTIDLELLPDGDILLLSDSKLFKVGKGTGHLSYQSTISNWWAVSDVKLVPVPDGSFLYVYFDDDRETVGRYWDTDGGGLGSIIELPIPKGASIVHGQGELYFAWAERDGNGDRSIALGTTDGSSSQTMWVDAAGTTPSDIRLWQLKDGRLLVTWTTASNGDGDGKSVMGQLVAEGVPIGDAFLLNAGATGDQSAVSIAALDDGRFVATWQTPGLDGDGFGIASRTFDPKSFTGGNGPDLLIGGSLSDTIVGGDGVDSLSGEGGDDSIDAGGGADIIYGSAGDDTIDGGEGADAYLLGSAWVDWDFEEDADGNMLVRWHHGSTYGTKTLANVEFIRFGDHSELAISGTLVNSGPAAVDDARAMDEGTEAVDRVAEGNVLANDSDVNTLIGDTLAVTGIVFNYEPGDPFFNVDVEVGTTISGLYGTIFMGSDGSYEYTLDNDDPALAGLSDGQILVDKFTYRVSDAKGLTDEATLTVTIHGNDDAPGNTISANGNANRIDTGSGTFNGKGATGEEDRIDGKGGNDTIKGGGGNDTLIGGSGKDKLTGGSGADKFVFKGKLGSSNIDTITDFKHDIDLIQLDDAIFAAIGASLTRSEFHARAGAKTAADRSDHIIYDTASGKLYYDADAKGGKAAVHFATLSGRPTLDHGDFAIV